jgi:hypothetical protein
MSAGRNFRIAWRGDANLGNDSAVASCIAYAEYND